MSNRASVQNPSRIFICHTDGVCAVMPSAVASFSKGGWLFPCRPPLLLGRPCKCLFGPSVRGLTLYIIEVCGYRDTPRCALSGPFGAGFHLVLWHSFTPFTPPSVLLCCCMCNRFGLCLHGLARRGPSREHSATASSCACTEGLLAVLEPPPPSPACPCPPCVAASPSPPHQCAAPAY